MNKKAFSVGDILPLAIVLVVATIGISIGADIVNNVRDGQTAASYAYNVSGSGLEGLSTFGDYLPTIALVVVAAVIIGVLVTYLARRN